MWLAVNGCFTIKYKANVTLTLEGKISGRYPQTYGVDSLETFTLGVKMNNVRVILSLAANFVKEIICYL